MHSLKLLLTILALKSFAPLAHSQPPDQLLCSQSVEDQDFPFAVDDLVEVL